MILSDDDIMDVYNRAIFLVDNLIVTYESKILVGNIIELAIFNSSFFIDKKDYTQAYYPMEIYAAASISMKSYLEGYLNESVEGWSCDNPSNVFKVLISDEKMGVRT